MAALRMRPDRLLTLVFLFSMVALAGPSGAEIRVSTRSRGTDTLLVDVLFPEPFRVQASGSEGQAVLEEPAALVLVSESDGVDVVRLEQTVRSIEGSARIAEDLVLNGSDRPVAWSAGNRNDVMAAVRIGALNGKSATLVRVFPSLPVRGGGPSQWIERVTLRCTGRGIRLADDAESGSLVRPAVPQRPRSPLDKSVSITPSLNAPALKIFISREGLYYLPQSMVVRAGWDMAMVDPRRFRVTGTAGELAIRVIGEEDGSFDFTDGIEFYGEPLWNLDKPGERRLDVYATQNVYWLELGDRPGRRMGSESAWISSVNEYLPSPRSFGFSQHEEADMGFYHLPYAESAQMDASEYWVYTAGPTGGQSIDVGFQLDDPDEFSTQLATVRLKIRGQTSSQNPQPIDVLVNGRLVVSEAWKENTVTVYESEGFSPTFLGDGTNRITLVNRSADGELSRVYLDWFEIEYPRLFKAKRNRLRFRAPERYEGKICRFKIEGFTDFNVDLYKIGSSRMTGGRVDSITDSLGNVTYTLFFEDDRTDPNEQYMAVAAGSKQLPDSVRFVANLGLRTETGGADCVVLVPSDSLGAEPFADWIALRESQGIRVKVVSLDSVYNAFNMGIPNPRAIRAFLSHAKARWSPAPRSAILVGDGTYDNRKCNTLRHLFPTAFHHTAFYGGAASDFWYSLLDDDPIPDIAIGRLPVNSRAELEAVLRKIIDYEKSPTDPWKNRCLIIGAGSSTGLFGVQTNTLIRNAIAPSIRADRMFLEGPPGDPDVGGTDRLLEYLSEGVGWVNFRGHGGGGIWADQGLLDLASVRDIRNPSRLPVVTSMTCFTADFMGSRPCLGESMVVQAENGAVAFFGSTAVGLVINDYLLLHHVVRTHAQHPDRTLGEIIQEAKIRYWLENVGDLALSEMHQYNLLGDPTLHLTFPESETTVDLARCAVAPTDSIRVQGASVPGSSHALFELTDADGRIQLTHSADLPDGPWDLALPPSGKTAVRMGLRAYFWNPQTGMHTRSYTPFAIGSAFFDSVSFDPPVPTRRDSIRIRVRIESAESIKRATCRFLQPLVQDMAMNPVSESGWYAAAATVGPFPSGTTVRYRIIAETASGTVAQGDSLSLMIPSPPDLAVYGLSFGGVSHVNMQALARNFGQENVPFTRIRFECPALEWTVEETVALAGNSQSLVSVPFMPVEGKYSFVVRVNPDSAVEELDFSNDVYSREMLIERFDVTPDRGSLNRGMGPAIVSIPSSGPVRAFGCSIPPAVVAKPSIVQLRQEFRVDETGPGEPDVLVMHRLSFIEVPQDTVFANPFNLFFISDSVRNQSGWKPYAWNHVLNRWVSCAAELHGDTVLVHARSPGLFSFQSAADREPPFIEIQCDDQPLTAGSYVSDRPNLGILIQDPSGVDIRPESFTVLIDEAALPPDATVFPDSVENPALIRLSLRPSLAKGEHSLYIRASDVHGNTLQTEPIRFQVSDRFDIQFLGNHPNPFKRETVFVYVLTEYADRLSIKLYTVSGRLIRTLDDPTLATPDYHELEWDGRDDAGEEVANGVYFYRILAVKDQERRELTGKIAKIK
jgi:hypothetical protein